MQQMYSKSNSSSSHKSKQLNSDCVHRISSIITDDTVFPLNLKFISKHVNGLIHAIPGKKKYFVFFLFLFCKVVVHELDFDLIEF